MTREPLSPSKNFESTPYLIKALGRLDLQGIKITSWNPLINNYQKQNPDGAVPRPYIIIESGADPSNISSSEIAYLGYNSSRKQGLSFYGGDRSSLMGNKIHDLWYGFFSTNVSQMIIQNNSVYSNLRYGIDPHMLSHDMVIKENYIHDSRIGIICSLDCTKMIIENNRIENNKDIGLMLSRNTTNSTLRYNNISYSDIGLSISESHSNRIYDNTIMRSQDGLTIKNNSSNNALANNTITYAIDCGILVSTGSHSNIMEDNYIEKYEKSGICLVKGASHNTFQSNQIDGRGLFGISVKDAAKENRFQDNAILIANNAIRIYNNSGTLFTNNKIGNTYGHQYIISGHSELNLTDTRFLGDRVRFAGTDVNTVKIWNSGIIDIMTLRPGNNDTAISRYNTNIKPYFANLSTVTIKIYSLNK